MFDALRHSLIALTIVTLLELLVIVRILLRPHRDPASRIAWMAVVGALPLVGMVAYLLLGEANIGGRRSRRLRSVLERISLIPGAAAVEAGSERPSVPLHWRHLFELGRSISGFRPVEGNRSQLMADSNATIDAMVADVDAAQDHVHLLFYIWLPDNNGCKVVEALKRAHAAWFAPSIGRRCARPGSR